MDAQQLDFADMERVAALVEGLAVGTLTALVQHRTVATVPPCSQCGTACSVDYEDRPLTVDTGHVLTLHEPVCHCPQCRRNFSPLQSALRLDGHNFSPTVLAKIAVAMGRLNLAAQATFALQLARINISCSQVQRIAQEIGNELAQQRDQKVVQQRRRELPVRVDVVPAVVAVEVDGGHLRTRAGGQGPGVHEAQGKENKVAALVTLQSTPSQQDPQPRTRAGV